MARPTLVTGAAGFAGSHVLDMLARTGVDVIAWHRPGSAIPALVGRISWQPVNLLDRQAVRDAVRSSRPDRVFHCAGAAHVGQAWSRATEALAINVLGTHHLIESLRAAAPDARILIPSSAHVYAPDPKPLGEDSTIRPASPYGLSKLAQELLAHGNSGGPLVYIARPFNHVGPRQDAAFVAAGFAARIAAIEAGREAPTIFVGNLEPRRDLADVRDTVRAYHAILDNGEPGRPYNVCTGRAIAIADLLDMFLARARVAITVQVDPDRYRPSDLPLVVGDPSRIRRELGWSPDIPLERTIDDILAFWRERVGTS